jgi:two-component system nitrate/nitrite response regulator NarL
MVRRHCGPQSTTERGEVRIPSTTVLVADGDGDARAKLSALLLSAGYRVSQAGDGDDAIRIARMERPSVAILEIPLPVLSGYEVCRALKSELGASFPVLFLSGSRTESYDRVAGLMIGADDYLVKPYAPDELLARLRLLEVRSDRAGAWTRSKLTPRESEVLALLAHGLTQQQIAERLIISPKTVGTHIEHVLRKLGVHSRAQAVAVAMRGGNGDVVADVLTGTNPPALGGSSIT